MSSIPSERHFSWLTRHCSGLLGGLLDGFACEAPLPELLIDVSMLSRFPGSKSLWKLPQSRNRDHDFPHLGIRLEILVGLNGLGKRKYLRDLRMEAPIRQTIIDILLRRWEPLRIAGDRHQRIATNAQSLSEGQQQRKGCRLHRKRAILKDNSLRCGGLGQLFQKWPGNRIKDHARTLAASNLLHTRDEVFFLSGDYVAGTQGEQLSFLIALARGCD